MLSFMVLEEALDENSVNDVCTRAPARVVRIGHLSQNSHNRPHTRRHKYLMLASCICARFLSVCHKQGGRPGASVL